MSDEPRKGIAYYFVWLIVWLFGAPDSPGVLSRWFRRS